MKFDKKNKKKKKYWEQSDLCLIRLNPNLSKKKKKKKKKIIEKSNIIIEVIIGCFQFTNYIRMN